MLVIVFHGSSTDTAKNKGAMYFEALPARGDEVEIERKAYIVSRAWHVPSPFYAGSKAAILINEAVAGKIEPNARELASA